MIVIHLTPPPNGPLTPLGFYCFTTSIGLFSIGSIGAQGITVNLRQVSRAKALAEKRLRGGSDTESESGRTGTRGDTDGKGKGPAAAKRRRGIGFTAAASSAAAAAAAALVPNLSAEADEQVRNLCFGAVQ